jgi:hypothetical protein
MTENDYRKTYIEFIDSNCKLYTMPVYYTVRPFTTKCLVGKIYRHKHIEQSMIRYKNNLPLALWMYYE